MPRIPLVDYSEWLLKFGRTSEGFVSDPLSQGNFDFYKCVMVALPQLLGFENWNKFMEKFVIHLEKRGVDIDREDLTYRGTQPINYFRIRIIEIYRRRSSFITMLSRFLEGLFVAELAKTNEPV